MFLIICFILLSDIPLSSIRSISNIMDGAENAAASDGTATPTIKPKRTGSLGLFYRKFYHLAHLRTDMLCHTLQILDEDVRRKIWTTFEYAIMNHTDLMKDRHLDQLLMCSLYIVCKVVGQDRNFTDVMKQYKTQPQAASHVYRSVLLGLKTAKDQEEKSENKTSSVNPPPTPTRVANSSTIVDGEERGDLIKFYNNVFMHRLQEFGLKFKRSRQAEAPPLSPLPKLRFAPQSPCRKVSENHSVYIRPLKQTPNDVVSFNPSSPHKPLSYSFSRSPAKDLKAINELMRTEVRSVGKRLLPQEEGEEEEVAQVVMSQGQTILLTQGDAEPPIKVQIVGGAGAVNSKLGSILGDRN
jgi:retinoblastoma-like protein 1